MTAEAIYTLVEKGGTIGILIVVVVGLVYYINKKTVSKEQYEETIKEIGELKKEVRETVGPALDRMTTIAEKQDHINENLARQNEMTERWLIEMSKDLNIVTHELNMRRLQGTKKRKK